MEHSSTLWSLPVGESAIVLPFDAGLPMERRLMDMGFTEGVRVRCLFAAPSGEPRAFLVRGSVVALRREDASFVPAERGV